MYLGFHKACLRQGLQDLPYQSIVQPYGAWISIVGFIILVLIDGFDVYFPGRWSISSFLTGYVGIPIFLSIYFGHLIWRYRFNDQCLRKPDEVDLSSGLQDVLATEELTSSKPQHWWEHVKVLWE